MEADAAEIRHLLAVLEYDGTDFAGFQRQKEGRTVQEEFEKALQPFSKLPVRVVGGGRTDAGVHAEGQTASFSLRTKYDLATLQRGINAKLPRDLAVKSLREVPEGFSARYSALSRTYRYGVLNQEVRSPLQERFALWVPHRLDDDAIREAGVLLEGRKDFGAFGKPPRGDNTVRELMRCVVRRDGVFLFFQFEGNAFLYRMVRRLVGTLIEIGRGKMAPTQLKAILDKKTRAGDAVPAHGLTLIQVKYCL